MTSLIDVARPSQKSLAILFDCLTVFSGSLFIAMLSQISFHTGFSAVPLTLQTLAVLLMGGLLGSKKGALAVMTYLAEGSLGIPVFAGGAAGLAKLVGPTGGYLLGFILCAFLVGYLLEKGWKEKYFLTLVAMTIGSLVILAIGSFWLSFFVGSENALYLGVYPFLIGDACKIVAAGALIPSGWKMLQLLR